MITIKDIQNMKKDTKNSIVELVYKCTNCHEYYLDKEDAEECCPE